MAISDYIIYELQICSEKGEGMPVLHEILLKMPKSVGLAHHTLPNACQEGSNQIESKKEVMIIEQ